MFFRKDKRERFKKKILHAYNKGFDKAETQKNEQIRKLKIKHYNIVKSKDNKILELEKKVQRIDEALNQHSDIVCLTNNIIKKVKNNSYAQTMMTNSNHQKIETVNDEIELLEIKMNKSKQKIDAKILDFKRVINE